ncbi:MAG TPA: DMT family transporter [Azospirillaceae bacterium]|nr:DMT family transporter [Azospirillaceae bacterium]
MSIATASPAAPGNSAYRVTGLLLAIGGVLAFSLRPLLIKLSYAHGADPVTLLFLRMSFSLPFFLAIALWLARKGGGPRVERRDLVMVGVLGFVGYYLASMLDFMGLQYVTAGIGRLLMFLYPTFVVVLSWLFLRKRIGAREAGALALTYGGVGLVLSHAVAGANANLPLGAALILSSAFAYAVYLVMGSRVIGRIGSLRFTAWATTVACLFCIAQFLVLRPMAALDLPWQVFALSGVMAVVSTVLPIFMTAEALRRIGANPVAMAGALGPVSNIVIGHVGLGEDLTWIQGVGAVLILAGVLLVSLKTAQPKPVPPGDGAD